MSEMTWLELLIRGVAVCLGVLALAVAALVAIVFRLLSRIRQMEHWLNPEVPRNGDGRRMHERY